MRARLTPCSRVISVSRPRKLAASLSGHVGLAWGHEARQALERDPGRLHAQRRSGADQQARAILLEAAAQGHLGAHLGQAREHALHVPLADRRALREDGGQQPARRGQLGVEVGEHLPPERDPELSWLGKGAQGSCLRMLR